MTKAVPGSRMRRSTYWLLQLSFFIGTFVVALTGEQALTALVQLVVMVGSIITGVQRMHDTDRNGWYFFIPFYSFIITLEDGTPGPNRYGPDPKGRERAYSTGLDPSLKPRPEGNLDNATRLPKRIGEVQLSAEAVDAVELEGTMARETRRG